MTMRWRLSAGFSAVLLAACLCARLTSADEMVAPILLEGEDASLEELALWEYVERQRYVRAREEAEAYLAEHPDSYVAHLALGMAQHYGEANFPKALFHETRALELFEAKEGVQPTQSQPWRWHARRGQSRVAWICPAPAQTHRPERWECSRESCPETSALRAELRSDRE